MNDADINTSEQGVGFAFNDSRIIFEDGKINVYRNNKVSGQYDISDFSKHPNSVFRRLQENLK